MLLCLVNAFWITAFLYFLVIYTEKPERVFNVGLNLLLATMIKIISSLEQITRSKECRVIFSRHGSHIFGGEIENLEITGLNPLTKVHHIFTIDTFDQYSPIKFSECRYLPLIFPLSYEDANHISYLITGELAIRILNVSGCAEEDEAFFPNNLPFRKAKLKPLSYAQKRILHSDIREKSFLDKRRMKKLWNGQLFRVSGMLEYNSSFGPCLNNSKSDNTSCSSWKFAVFPATQIPFGDIWNEIPSDVIFEFFVCKNCDQIHASLNCT